MPDKKTNTPAYASYPTFQTFIQSMNESALPPRIDRSVMTGISGSNQGSLLSALSFLQLVDHGGRVTDSMRKLVKAYGTDKWKDELNAILATAYEGVVTGVDLDVGSFKQLQDAFKVNGGVDGQVLEKCLRFYLAALKDGGSTFSPHFNKPRSARTGGKTANKKKPAAKSGVTPPAIENNGDSTPPKGMRRYPLFFKGKSEGSLIVPENLSASDCKVIELQLAVLVQIADE